MLSIQPSVATTSARPNRLVDSGAYNTITSPPPIIQDRPRSHNANWRVVPGTRFDNSELTIEELVDTAYDDISVEVPKTQDMDLDETNNVKTLDFSDMPPLEETALLKEDLCSPLACSYIAV